MKLITHNLGKFPENVKYQYGTITELNDYDFEEIKRNGIEEIWYYYAMGDYEGMGHILMRKGNLYDLHDAGHCSCYGPTDKLDFKGMSFEELEKSLTKEYYEEVKELFELAKNTVI